MTQVAKLANYCALANARKGMIGRLASDRNARTHQKTMLKYGIMESSSNDFFPGQEVPYTILILKVMAAQLAINFVAAAITSGMQPSVNGARRNVMQILWAVTGLAFIVAVVWDIFKFFK